MSAAVSRLVEAGVIAEAGALCHGRPARLVTSDGRSTTRRAKGATTASSPDGTPPAGRAGLNLLIIFIAEGPRRCSDTVMDECCQEKLPACGSVIAPEKFAGPVDAERSRVIRPARMPRWDGINVAEL